jgi:hypothetical protein
MHERFLPLYELVVFCPTALAAHVRPGAASPSGYPSSNAAFAYEVSDDVIKDAIANTVNNLRGNALIPN